VGSHIVRTFRLVFVEPRILGHQALEKPLHIRAYRGIGAFIDSQAGTSVLEEEMQQTYPYPLQLGKVSEDFVGH